MGITEDISKYDKDMDYWEGDKYVGFGIKKMKAYKCKLNLTELQKKRENFWKLKIKNNNENQMNWSIIHKAITLDEPRNIHYLQHFKIKPKNGCINECIDEKGNIYKIPNYCINDPYFEREINDNNEIENEIIDVKIYGYDCEPFILKISNKIKGKNLKEECIKHKNLDKNIKIRIFIGGVEVKDEGYIYQHNISKDKPIFLVLNYF